MFSFALNKLDCWELGDLTPRPVKPPLWCPGYTEHSGDMLGKLQKVRQLQTGPLLQPWLLQTVCTTSNVLWMCPLPLLLLFSLRTSTQHLLQWLHKGVWLVFIQDLRLMELKAVFALIQNKILHLYAVLTLKTPPDYTARLLCSLFYFSKAYAVLLPGIPEWGPIDGILWAAFFVYMQALLRAEQTGLAARRAHR